MKILKKLKIYIELYPILHDVNKFREIENIYREK